MGFIRMTNQTADTDTVKSRQAGETLASTGAHSSTVRNSSSDETVSGTAEELAQTRGELRA